MSWTLVRQRCLAMSWMGGSAVPILFSAVLIPSLQGFPPRGSTDSWLDSNVVGSYNDHIEGGEDGRGKGNGEGGSGKRLSSVCYLHLQQPGATDDLDHCFIDENWPDLIPPQGNF